MLTCPRPCLLRPLFLLFFVMLGNLAQYQVEVIVAKRSEDGRKAHSYPNPISNKL